MSTQDNMLEMHVDECLYEMHLPLFEAVLRKAAETEAGFEHRVKTLAYHGLLDFFSQVPYKPKPVLDRYTEDKDGDRTYCFDEDQLAKPSWKRTLIRKLKVQRPGGVYTRHRLAISREQILADAKYVTDIAKVLSYKWAGLLGSCTLADCRILQLADLDALVHFLDSFRFDIRSLACMKAYLLRRESDRFLDKAKFKELFAQIEDRLKLVCKNSESELEKIGEKLPRLTLGEVLDDVADNLKFVDEIKSWAEGQKGHAAMLLSECTHSKLTDAGFRRAVDARITRRKAARKRLLAHMRRKYPYWLMFYVSSRLTVFSLALLSTFYIKVGYEQVTIAELISRWLH